MKEPTYFNEISAFFNFILVFVVSAFIAIPLALAFEYPIDAINRLTNASPKTQNNSLDLPSIAKSIENKPFD